MRRIALGNSIAPLLLVFFIASPAAAFLTIEGELFSLELGGSLRTVAAALDNYEEPLLFGEDNSADGVSETILRITAEGKAGPFAGYEAHLVQDLFFSSSAGGSAAPVGIASAAGRYRFTDLSTTWADAGDLRATLSLDRLNAAAAVGRTDVTFGRQAVNFSQAYFWNPLDIFLAFDPEAFDRSYKPGVDALRVDYSLGPFSSLTLVAAAGRRLRIEEGGEGLAVAAEDFDAEPWYGSAILARGRTNLGLWDLTLQGGKVYGGYQLGGGFSGEIGVFGMRGEATAFSAAGESFALNAGELVQDYVKVVVGADHRFEGGLHLNLEYFYNGAGDGDDLELALARVALGETTNLGEHLLGLQASRELHPLLVGQVSWIHSFCDGSDLLSPTLSWSVADEAELLLGAILGFGDRPARRVAADGREFLELRSEFGTYPDLYFLELIFYF